MTFRKRLILYFSGLLAIFILVFGVLVYTVLDSALMQSVDRRLEETATLVINNSRGLSSLVSTQRVIVLPRLDIFSFPGVGVRSGPSMTVHRNWKLPPTTLPPWYDR